MSIRLVADGSVRSHSNHIFRFLGSIQLQFLTLLVLLLQLCAQASAQPRLNSGFDQESGCWINSGVALTSYDITTPSEGRIFKNLRILYSSAAGWRVDIPHIIRDQASGEHFYYDGLCRSRIYLDPTTGFWRAGTGGRFDFDSSTGTFAYLNANGSATEFGHFYVDSSGFDVWLPSESRDRFGWTANYFYRSSHPSQLQTVEVDRHQPTSSAPRFFYQLWYDTNNRLDEVRVEASTGNLLLSHDLHYSSSDLTAIEHKSGNGNSLGSTNFEYYLTGPFSGLLRRKVTPLGGAFHYGYRTTQVNELNGSGTRPLNILQDFVSHSETGGGSKISLSYQHSGGIYSGNRFFGFAQLEKADGSGEVESREFRVSSKDEVGVLDRVTFSDSRTGFIHGEHLVHWNSNSTTAGLQLAPAHLVDIQRDPGSGIDTTSGVEVVWDLAAMRPILTLEHNQTSYDTSQNTFGNVHLQDNQLVTYVYKADVPSLGIRDQIDYLVIQDHLGAIVEQTQVHYNPTTRLPEKVSEWDSQSGNYEDTTFSFDGWGNISGVSTASGSYQLLWAGADPLRLTVDPSGVSHETRFVHNSESGLVENIIEPDGNTRVIGYDEFFRPTSEILRDRYGYEDIVLSTLKYFASPPKIERTTLGTHAIIALDGFGRSVKVSEPLKPGASVFASKSSELNSFGKVARTTIPSYFSRSDVVDDKSDSRGAHHINSVYDQIGRLSGLYADRPIDGVGSADMLHFGQGGGGSPALNPQARSYVSRIGVVRQSGHFANTRYHYYGFGGDQTQLTFKKETRNNKLIDSLGNVYTRTEDSLGRTLSVNPPLGSAYTVTYGQDRRTDEIQYASGKKEIFQTDGLGRNTSIDYHDPQTLQSHVYTFEYDRSTYPGFEVRDGLLASILGPNDKIYFDYDNFGRVRSALHVHIETPHNRERLFEFQYEYESGALRRIYYPGEFAGVNYIEYDFDSRGRERSIYSTHIKHQQPNGILRTISSRDVDGQVKLASYYNSLRESYGYSSTSGALMQYRLQRVTDGTIHERKDYTYEQNRLLRKDVLIHGQTAWEEYDQIDSRGFFTQVRRKIGSNPVQTLSYDWDNAGRQMGDPAAGFEYVYNNGSSHPYELDALKKNGVTYPWGYNSDDQLASTTGPNPGQNLTIDYGPDTEIRRVTKPTGETLTFYRSVFGDLARAEVRDPQGTLTYVYRKFLLGLYEEEFDTEAGEEAIINVYGELTRGGEGVVARFRYPMTQPSTLLGGPEGIEPGTTTEPSPSPRRRRSICGNGKKEAGEQCEKDTDCPLGQTCDAKCNCGGGGPPPTGIRIEIGTVSYDENGDPVIDPETAAILIYLSIIERYVNETQSFPGFPTESKKDCDQIELSNVEGTIPLIVLEAFKEIDQASIYQYGMLQEFDEHWEEVPLEEPQEEEDGWFFFIVHTGLDIAGCIDPTGICDGANAVIYLVRGRYTDAGISALSIIPIVGDAAKATRTGQRICKTVSNVTAPITSKVSTAAGKTGEVILKTAGRATSALRRVVTRTGRYRCDDLKVILGDWSHYLKVADETGAIAFDIPKHYFDSLPLESREAIVSALNREFIEFASFLHRSAGATLELNLSAPMREIYEQNADRFLSREIHDLIHNQGFSLRRDLSSGGRRGFFVNGTGTAANRLGHFYNNACGGTLARPTFSLVNPWGGHSMSSGELRSVLWQSIRNSGQNPGLRQQFDSFMRLR